MSSEGWRGSYVWEVGKAGGRGAWRERGYHGGEATSGRKGWRERGYLWERRPEGGKLPLGAKAGGEVRVIPAHVAAAGQQDVDKKLVINNWSIQVATANGPEL